MGAAAVAAAGIAGLQLFQGSQSAEGARQKARFQADVLKQNAKIADMQAEDVLRRGEEAVFEKRLEGKRVIGAQRAALAAQGIELGSGSALDIQGDTAAQAEIDALTIRNNAFREAMGYRMRAGQLRTEARGTRLFGSLTAQQTLLGSGVAAAGTAFSMAGRS